MAVHRSTGRSLHGFWALWGERTGDGTESEGVGRCQGTGSGSSRLTKLASRAFRPEGTQIAIGRCSDRRTQKVVVMAGPCAGRKSRPSRGALHFSFPGLAPRSYVEEHSSPERHHIPSRALERRDYVIYVTQQTTTALLVVSEIMEVFPDPALFGICRYSSESARPKHAKTSICCVPLGQSVNLFCLKTWPRSNCGRDPPGR